MLVLLVGLLVCIVIGVPIGYALGLSAFAYFIIEQPALTGILPQRFFAGMNSYAMIALPLFILMGQVMNASGITGRLLDFSLIFVGRLKGGLGLVNVFASMIFGGISGSAASDTASIGSILIPEMKKRGYSAEFAAGITVASSTMGMIIPPSMAMVLYAIVAQESVGRLFMGGIIPGLGIGLLQLLIVYWLSARRNYPTEDVVLNLQTITREFQRSGLVLLMPLLVVGSVVFGLATPTESAGLGVFYGLLIGVAIVGLDSFKSFPKSLHAAIITTAKIMVVIAFSQLYIWVLALERIPDQLADFIISLGLGPTALLILVALVILAAGTFIDVSPAILLLTPVLLPAVKAVGVDGVHFGVIMVSGLAVGACTPPVGTCLNVCAVIARMGIGRIFLGAAPFLAANAIVLFLICVFPGLVMWIPNLVYGAQ